MKTFYPKSEDEMIEELDSLIYQDPEKINDFNKGWVIASVVPKDLLKTKLQNLKQNIIESLNYNSNYVSEEVVDMFVKNIIVREDKFDWKLNYLNGILEDEELSNDNPLEGDKDIFLTRIVITKDDVDRFIEHHKEYSRLRLKEPIKVDIYL